MSLFYDNDYYQKILESVKINKGTSHWNGVRKFGRGSSHDLPLLIHCRENQVCEYCFAILGRRTASPTPATAQPMRDSHSSANEKLLCLEHAMYSKGFLVYNIPSHLPAFLYKIAVLSVVLWICLWFFHSLLSPSYNSLLFPNKYIFCW